MVDAALQKNISVWVYKFSKEYLPVSPSTSIRDRDKTWLRPKDFTRRASDSINPQMQMQSIQT